MRKRILAFILIVAALTVGATLLVTHFHSKNASQNYTLVEDGKLTVAMSVSFAPFEQYDENGNPVGYDVAVAQEVAARLGLECNIVNVPFSHVVGDVSKSKYDVGISAISINPERSEKVDFTSPYYISDLAVVCKKGAFNSVSALKEENVAAQRSSTGYDYAVSNINKYTLPCADPKACFDAMEQGSVAAAVVDAPAARYLMVNGYTGYSILETVATGEKYSIAVNKSNRPLTEAINEALRNMDEDGTLERLQKQYGL